MAHSWPGRSSLGRPSNGPATTLCTSTPGAIGTLGDWSPEVARVKISTSVPRCASRRATSAMYTFIPPASPVPGWSSGDVCTLIMATRRGALRSGTAADMVPTIAARARVGNSSGVPQLGEVAGRSSSAVSAYGSPVTTCTTRRAMVTAWSA